MVDKLLQKRSKPPIYASPKPKISNPANSRMTPCKKSVKMIAVCPPSDTYVPEIIATTIMFELISYPKIGCNNEPSANNPIPIYPMRYKSIVIVDKFRTVELNLLSKYSGMEFTCM